MNFMVHRSAWTEAGADPGFWKWGGQTLENVDLQPPKEGVACRRHAHARGSGDMLPPGNFEI